MTKPNGGSAFPYSALSPGGPQMYDDARGMSLRDYFAAQALNSLLHRRVWTTSDQMPDAEIVAEHAYRAADAMLVERAK